MHADHFIWYLARQIANSLVTNTQLTALHLDWNMAGALGGHAFSRALRINSTLRILNLEAADLTDDGVAQVAKSLATNRGLRELATYPTQPKPG